MWIILVPDGMRQTLLEQLFRQLSPKIWEMHTFSTAPKLLKQACCITTVKMSPMGLSSSLLIGRGSESSVNVAHNLDMQAI